MISRVFVFLLLALGFTLVLGQVTPTITNTASNSLSTVSISVSTSLSSTVSKTKSNTRSVTGTGTASFSGTGSQTISQTGSGTGSLSVTGSNTITQTASFSGTQTWTSSQTISSSITPILSNLFPSGTGILGNGPTQLGPSKRQYSLKWLPAAGTNWDGYRVQYRVLTSPSSLRGLWTNFIYLKVGGFHTYLGGLQPNTAYEFRVAAYDVQAAQLSAFSNTFRIKTAAGSGGFDSFYCPFQSARHIVCGWRGPSGNISNADIEVNCNSRALSETTQLSASALKNHIYKFPKRLAGKYSNCRYYLHAGGQTLESRLVVRTPLT